MELLSSLLMRFEMELEKRFREKKLLLKIFLTQLNLNFLQEYCESAIRELTQLVVFYDLPLNLLNTSIDLGNLNLFKFMLEVKNRKTAEPSDVDFQLNLWNLLEN